MNESPLLQVKGLRTWFETFKGTVKAVDDVSFEVRQGEVLAVVGESGGGKSVTGFSIIRLIDEPGHIVSGEIIFDGRDVMKLPEHEMNKIRGRDISMVFQDPMTSLNPVYSIGQQIDEMLKLHTTLNRAERHAESIRLLNAVGISNAEARLKNYPHQFSGGMRQRVVIAIALAAKPKLIIADEPTTALDVTIQAQILRLMTELIRKEGCSLMLITHDLAVVSEIADRINVMYCGKIVESGTTRAVIDNSLHPYTAGLIRSIPDLERSQKRLDTIPGIVPNMFNLPEGCYFSPRCRYAQELCHRKAPELREIEPGHCAACHFPLHGASSEVK
ncbi:MAG: ABC transporter ATP-binding protein [Pyramidobacter sp.]|jgi:oligopeptide/dipeptide ABC transporter ATP-binding protein